MLSWISTVQRELVGLFVEDGSFALAVLAWLAGGAICIHLIGVDPAIEGVLLAAGFTLLLAENVDRTARGARGQPEPRSAK
jgi:hypothetical protein